MVRSVWGCFYVRNMSYIRIRSVYDRNITTANIKCFRRQNTKKYDMRLQSFIECDPKCVKDDLSQIRISGERERPEMGNIMMMTNITMSKHRFASFLWPW